MNNKVNELVFTKDQLKQANEFVLDKDVIEILADKDRNYTKNEMRKLVQSFRNKEVE